MMGHLSPPGMLHALKIINFYLFADFYIHGEEGRRGEVQQY
jgi:hypothetical protein